MPDLSTLEWVAAVVAGPSIGYVVHAALHRRKNRAEYVGTVAEQWEKWSKAQGERIDKLEGRVDELEKALAFERRTVATLTEQVVKYREIAKALARHVIELRDAFSATEAPTMPIDVEDALTTIDLPHEPSI